MVLRDADTKEKLKALAWDQPKVVEAPVTLIVLADKDGWQEGHPTVEKNWQEMLDSGDNKIGRPRQLYVGQEPRKFETVETRSHSTRGINWKWLWGGKRNGDENAA